MEDTIRREIKTAATFSIFWCCHSAVSRAVAEEIDIALASHKPIVLFRLCKVSVPPSLSEFQWINHSTTAIHSCLDHKLSDDVSAVDYESLVPFVPRGRPGGMIPIMAGILDLAEDGQVQNVIKKAKEL
jgi:hypothetical protein